MRSANGASSSLCGGNPTIRGARPDSTRGGGRARARQREVPRMRRCSAEVSDVDLAVARPFRVLLRGADLRGQVDLGLVEKVGNKPGWKPRKVADLLGEERVRRDHAIAEPHGASQSCDISEPELQALLLDRLGERLHYEVCIPVVEHEIVDVVEHPLPEALRPRDQGADVHCVGRPTDHEQVDLVEHLYRACSVVGRQPRSRRVGLCIAERLDHIERSVSERARVRGERSSRRSAGRPKEAWLSLREGRSPRILIRDRTHPGREH